METWFALKMDEAECAGGGGGTGGARKARQVSTWHGFESEGRHVSRRRREAAREHIDVGRSAYWTSLGRVWRVRGCGVGWSQQQTASEEARREACTRCSTGCRSCLRRVPEWELCGRDGGQSREVKRVSARQVPRRVGRDRRLKVLDPVWLSYRCSVPMQSSSHSKQKLQRCKTRARG